MSRWWERPLAGWLLPVAVIGGLLGTWEAMVRLRDTPAWLLPPPSAVARAIARDRALLLEHGVATAGATLLGFALALMAGLVIGAALAGSPLLARTIAPLVVGSQTVPVVAVAPLLVIWFGYGLAPKVLVTALIAFFPIAIAWGDGLRRADRDALALVTAFGAGRWRRFRLVSGPGALPALFSGARVGASVAVIGAVFGELVGSSRGLGYLLTRSTATFQTDRVVAVIVALAVVALGLYGVVALVERATTSRWERVK